MTDLILLIIFFGCTLSIGMFVAKKLPTLEQMPESAQIKKNQVPLSRSLRIFCLSIVNRIPMLGEWVKDFSYITFLQKLLTKIRILILKLENKTAFYLEKLRTHASQAKETADNDNYWSDIRNLIKNKDGARKRASSAVQRTNTVVEKVSEIKFSAERPQKKAKRKHHLKAEKNAGR